MIINHSAITCPSCGGVKTETMPTDACRVFYECTGCGMMAAEARRLGWLPVPGGPGKAHRCVKRSRSALPTTDTELRLIAAAATIGLSSRPKAGYSTPAASGMPSTL
jgi:hypothetical protein